MNISVNNKINYNISILCSAVILISVVKSYIQKFQTDFCQNQKKLK